MKKSLFTLFVAAVLSFAAFSMVSCGGAGGKNPADIEMSIWKEMQKGNYEKGFTTWLENSSNYTADESKSEEYNEMVKALAEKGKAEIEKKGGIDNVEIVKEEISEDGNSASVTVKMTFKDGTTDEQSSNYVKVDDQWKIKTNK